MMQRAMNVILVRERRAEKGVNTAEEEGWRCRRAVGEDGLDQILGEMGQQSEQ